MHCILHIGTEKTGSTAIQHFLHSNWHKLKQGGAHVCTSVGKPNNRSLPAAFMSEDKCDDFLRRHKLQDADDRRAWTKKLQRGLVEEISKAKKDSQIFVISSEHFHSRLTSPAEVSNFHEFLAPLFERVTVICYLRRQDHLAMSRYSEAMRAGHVHQSPLPKFAKNPHKRLPPYFDFAALLDRWAEFFGEENVQPQIYAKEELLDGNVIHDFLHITGLRLDNPNEPNVDKANMSLSAEAQAVLLGVNRKISESGAREASMRLRGKLVRYLQVNAPGASRRPTAEEAEEFYKVFEASNNLVAKRWFDKDQLFDTDFTNYPDLAPVVSGERASELLAGFMLREMILLKEKKK
jgi:hypothetical protein